MSDAIVVAIITGLASIIGQFMISKKGKKDRLVQEAVRRTELDNQLSNIETKLDIHNGYAEKIGNIETSIAVIQTEIVNLKGELNR